MHRDEAVAKLRFHHEHVGALAGGYAGGLRLEVVTGGASPAPPKAAEPTLSRMMTDLPDAWRTFLDMPAAYALARRNFPVFCIHVYAHDLIDDINAILVYGIRCGSKPGLCGQDWPTTPMAGRCSVQGGAGTAGRQAPGCCRRW